MTGILQEVTIAPDVDPDTAPWWAALADGQLTIPHCRTCQKHFFPPTPSCPHCGGTDIDFEASAGLGTVYSWIVVHHALDTTFVGHTPYTVVAVQLDEGVRLFGRIEAGPLDETTRVRALPYRVGDTALLGFERI